jgi:hypothetical protein
MMLVMSPAGVASNNARDEWSYFLGKGRAVYPFIFQPCELPFSCGDVSTSRPPGICGMM